MLRPIRIASLAVASALAFAPAAFADSPYGDTTGVGLMHASTVKAPPAADTTGVGLIHASMVQAQLADRTAAASSDSGFQWPDAAIGVAGGIGAALAGVSLVATVRNRRRVVA